MFWILSSFELTGIELSLPLLVSSVDSVSLAVSAVSDTFLVPVSGFRVSLNSGFFESFSFFNFFESFLTR
jgi:hypothetical protein